MRVKHILSHNKKVQRKKSLEDLKSWRTLLSFYEDTVEKEKIVHRLIDAYKLFTKK